MRYSLALALTLGAAPLAQDRQIPRPPAQTPGTPEAGTTAPDGYAPIPQWVGQTRAPLPPVSAHYDVQTVATGVRGGFAFHFLPDRRIIVSERPGRIRVVSTDG